MAQMIGDHLFLGEDLKPFHESLVEAIKRVRDGNDFSVLAGLIRTTKIPAGHDEILAAWEERTQQLPGASAKHWDEDGYLGIPGFLRKQKMAAEAIAIAKGKQVSAEEKMVAIMETLTEITPEIPAWPILGVPAQKRIIKGMLTIQRLNLTQTKAGLEAALADFKKEE
jgi:hypothetical protein